MLEIKNYNQLARSDLRKKALDILLEGIESVYPERFIPQNISFKDNKLRIGGEEFELKGDLYIIGGGKASGLMAQELEKIIPLEKIKAGYVNCIKKVECRKIFVNEASHPVPNENGLNGVKEMLKLTSNLKKEDIVICLISGGGSALFPLPVEGVSLEDKQKVTNILLRCGSDHYEINTVRKALSAVKGGKLAKLLQPARVITIILSDDAGHKGDVASRPTSPDEDTFEDAYSILHKYKIVHKIPESALLYIMRGLRGEVQTNIGRRDSIWDRVHNYTLADNKISLIAMKKKAEELGFKALVYEENLECEITQAAEKIHQILKEKFLSEKGPIAFIHGSEITINVAGPGKGGRNQEFVVRMLEKLRGANVVVGAIGSDGVDFVEGVGGALADDTGLLAMEAMDMVPHDFLKKSDSYEIHRRLGNLIEMSPTSTNVGDLHIYLKE